MCQYVPIESAHITVWSNVLSVEIQNQRFLPKVAPEVFFSGVYCRGWPSVVVVVVVVVVKFSKI